MNELYGLLMSLHVVCLIVQSRFAVSMSDVHVMVVGQRLVYSLYSQPIAWCTVGTMAPKLCNMYV